MIESPKTTKIFIPENFLLYGISKMGGHKEDDDVLTVKCVLLGVMVIVTGISVLLPICVIRRLKEGNATRRKFILSFLNCFGGGIFVATGMCVYYNIGLLV